MPKSQEKKTRYWNLVLQGSTYTNVAEIEQKLVDLGLKYAFIEHKQDKDGEETLKPAHLHLVIAYDSPRSFTTVKNIFPSAHIEAVLSLVSSIQYLTHLNDKSKVQYKYEDIHTNAQEWVQNHYNQIDYIDNQLVLMNEILNGEYESWLDIVMSQKYSWPWLNKSQSIIQSLLVFAEKERRRMKKASDFFGD